MTETELLLEMISPALPDTSDIMDKVGRSWWHLIYAARGGNWGLARHYANRVTKLQKTLAMVREDHKERLDRFHEGALSAVVSAIQNQDLEQLEKAYSAATDMANLLHAETGHPFIKWVLPNQPPKGLLLDTSEPDAEGA